ncbi:hypothetical protein SAMN05421839_10572 [Halolactibacillus halophilus]|uniref:Uncharacterized protein n=1 Tax=Halolactibacillus halophilus TaxID=306540 RepID=A0A1I5MFT7_9BACI|nr:hypothetical protein [Halolactibacillus halophilus]GEM02199.1 hypothetical protein HHA03_17310 [Halolactibacillus halophilus]SFP08498.1 hypothetical protein SAMN05421839_10572 [Halolactibacillus halophilus]
MKRIYRSHFLGIELIISLLVIAVMVGIFYKYVGIEVLSDKLDGIREMLYGTLATLSGALIGFVITGLSVLLTTSSNERMEQLKRSKHYKTIFTIFFSTSKYLGVMFLISLISLIFDKDSNPVYCLTVLSIWSLIIVAFRIIRCIWVLEKIVGLHIFKN